MNPNQAAASVKQQELYGTAAVLSSNDAVATDRNRKKRATAGQFLVTRLFSRPTLAQEGQPAPPATRLQHPTSSHPFASTATRKNRPAIIVPPGGIGPVRDFEVLPTDVLCGRGGRINAHPGNVQFRRLVATRKADYLNPATPKLHKAHIAADIVQTVRCHYGGRFLKEDSEGRWFDVGDAKAIKKVGQALREENKEDLGTTAAVEPVVKPPVGAVSADKAVSNSVVSTASSAPIVVPAAESSSTGQPPAPAPASEAPPPKPAAAVAQLPAVSRPSGVHSSTDAVFDDQSIAGGSIMSTNTISTTPKIVARVPLSAPPLVSTRGAKVPSRARASSSSSEQANGDGFQPLQYDPIKQRLVHSEGKTSGVGFLSNILGNGGTKTSGAAAALMNDGVDEQEQEADPPAIAPDVHVSVQPPADEAFGRTFHIAGDREGSMISGLSENMSDLTMGQYWQHQQLNHQGSQPQTHRALPPPQQQPGRQMAPQQQDYSSYRLGIDQPPAAEHPQMLPPPTSTIGTAGLSKQQQQQRCSSGESSTQSFDREAEAFDGSSNSSVMNSSLLSGNRIPGTQYFPENKELHTQHYDNGLSSYASFNDAYPRQQQYDHPSQQEYHQPLQADGHSAPINQFNDNGQQYHQQHEQQQTHREFPSYPTHYLQNRSVQRDGGGSDLMSLASGSVIPEGSVILSDLSESFMAIDLQQQQQQIGRH